MDIPNIKFKKRKLKIEDYVGDSDHLVLMGWMINKLNLSGASLIVFAVIHNYTKSKNGYFYGSQNYLARWSNTSKSNANEVLKKLVSLGLITKLDKEITGYDQVVYYVSNVDSDKLIENIESLEYYKEKYGTGQESRPVKKVDRLENCTGVGKKVDTGSHKSGHNNIYIENNIENVVVVRELVDKAIHDRYGDSEFEYEDKQSKENFIAFIESLKINNPKVYEDFFLLSSLTIYSLMTEYKDMYSGYEKYKNVNNPEGIIARKITRFAKEEK